MRRKPLSNIRIIRIKKKNRILELIWDIIWKIISNLIRMNLWIWNRARVNFRSKMEI
jgi:hypothetical protein